MKVCRILANSHTFNNLFISNRDLLDLRSLLGLCPHETSLAGTPIHGRILSSVWCTVQALVCGHHGQWGRLVELCVVLSWSFSHLFLLNVDPYEPSWAPDTRPAVLFPMPSLPSRSSGWLEVTVKSRLTFGLFCLVS